MSLRKIFTRVNEHGLKNFYPSEVEKKSEKLAVKIGNA